jgi:glutamine synthetase
MYFPLEEKAKRLELRCPDPTCNPYLAFSAMLVAGIDGIKGKMNPTELGFGPFDENIWEKGSVKQTPGDLFTSLKALEDTDVFVKSGVFTQEIVDSYLEVKRTEAMEALRYPTPSDFYYYGDL